jgi:hypothetical protein
MSIRNVLVLAAALCVLPLSSVAAQQATDSARVPVSALTESVNVPADPLPAPTSFMLQRPEMLAAISLTPAPSLAAPPAGQHVFVVSTLALVLGIILLVVLID